MGKSGSDGHKRKRSLWLRVVYYDGREIQWSIDEESARFMNEEHEVARVVKLIRPDGNVMYLNLNREQVAGYFVEEKKETDG